MPVAPITTRTIGPPCWLAIVTARSEIDGASTATHSQQNHSQPHRAPPHSHSPATTHTLATMHETLARHLRMPIMRQNRPLLQRPAAISWDHLLIYLSTSSHILLSSHRPPHQTWYVRGASSGRNDWFPPIPGRPSGGLTDNSSFRRLLSSYWLRLTQSNARYMHLR